MLELIQIDAIKKEIEAYKSEVDVILEYTKRLEVLNKIDAQHAIDSIAKAKTLRDNINRKKLEITKDSRDFQKKINGIANGFLEPLFLVEEMIMQKISNWRETEEIAQKAEEANLAQLEEFGLAPVYTFEDLSVVRSDCGTVKVTEGYSFALQDKNLVPLEYLQLDEKRINLAIKNGIRCIPGLKIEKVTKTSMRRK